MNLYKVKISNEQFLYLYKNFFHNKEDFFDNINIDRNNNWVVIHINYDYADQIREWALDKLQEVGFETTQGELLEDIVDKFFIQ